MNLGVMTTDEYSILPSAPELKHHHWMQFWLSYWGRPLFLGGGVLTSLWKDIIDVILTTPTGHLYMREGFRDCKFYKKNIAANEQTASSTNIFRFDPEADTRPWYHLPNLRNLMTHLMITTAYDYLRGRLNFVRRGNSKLRSLICLKYFTG